MEYSMKMPRYWTSSRKRKTARVAAARKMTRQMQVYPFRILAVLLTVGILIELIAIMRIPDYTEELEKAREEYLLTKEENVQLMAAVDEANRLDTVRDAARDQGYTYYGETIYVPVIEGGNFADDAPDEADMP